MPGVRSSLGGRAAVRGKRVLDPEDERAFVDDSPNDALFLFGCQQLDDWRELVDGLCYVRHGGSGYGMTYGDAMDMHIADAHWFTQRLNENREDEARAIEQARSSS